MESLEESGAAVGGADRAGTPAGLPHGPRDRGAAAGAETRAVHTCASELGDRLGAEAEQWGTVRSPRLRLVRRWWRVLVLEGPPEECEQSRVSHAPPYPTDIGGTDLGVPEVEPRLWMPPLHPPYGGRSCPGGDRRCWRGNGWDGSELTLMWRIDWENFFAVHGGLRTEGRRCSTLRGSPTLLDIGRRWIPAAPRAYLTMGKLRHKIQGMPQAEQGHVCRWASDEPEEGAAPATMQDTLNKILGAIEDIKLTLSQEIGKVSSELSHLPLITTNWQTG
ncbi:hypothetical protein NDU88_007733 [Pleurodeles waltl]|uniref:Uncharacterized protein n=1 Tax=Pleurodeles waltl TaxID=8319 RepID=A0AAV7VTI0_PLEWA|nr:hypothetical protein NDU88_007733 [Pleurodeles waltl]